MKTHALLFAAVLFAGSAPTRAEGPQGETAPEPLQTPNLLAPAPKAPAALQKGTAEQLRQAIRIRELKTAVLENAEVQAWKEKAACAKTEEGRRIAMRNYYTLLYSKMEKLDPTLVPVLEGQLHNVLADYEQHIVRPSAAIEPITPQPGSRSEDHSTLAGLQVASPAKAIKIKSFSR